MTILCTRANGKWAIIKVYGLTAGDLSLDDIAHIYGFDHAIIFNKN